MSRGVTGKVTFRTGDRISERNLDHGQESSPGMESGRKEVLKRVKGNLWVLNPLYKFWR